MPKEVLDKQSELESLPLAEIERRKSWRKSPKNYKIYSKGEEQTPVQTSLMLGRTDTEFKELPQHPKNINLNPKRVGPSEEQLEASLPYAFTAVRKGKSHMRKTIHQTTYRCGVNQILKERGIDPYEWEPIRGFVHNYSPKEEQDYLENIIQLFSEHYP